MELTREHWSKEDIPEFQRYLLSFSKGEENGKWEQRIVNTKLPCIAVPSPEVKRIANEISKGNYREFLDLWIWENFTNTSVNGSVICKIKDFNLMVKYLDKHLKKCDNWATCDLLKFPINAKNKGQYFELSQRYVKSPETFVRRAGMTILLRLAGDDLYIDRILETLNSFYGEQEYYVNMVNAWVFAECFIKQREKTLKFLKTHKMNKFTVNKGISKCRDSFRVSDEDKEMLLQYRQK